MVAETDAFGVPVRRCIPRCNIGTCPPIGGSHPRACCPSPSSPEARVAIETPRTHPHAEITPSPSALWWAPFVDRFAILPPTDLPPRTHAGVSFQTFALNVPLYLSSLLRSFLSFPSPMSRLVKARLPAPLPTALLHAQSHLLRHEPVHAWVNATGLGAGNLVPDRAVYPVRGQTVLVRGEAKAVRTRLGGREGGGGLAYVIPRPGSGTTVLGGTKGEGVW